MQTCQAVPVRQCRQSLDGPAQRQATPYFKLLQLTHSAPPAFLAPPAAGQRRHAQPTVLAPQPGPSQCRHLCFGHRWRLCRSSFGGSLGSVGWRAGRRHSLGTSIGTGQVWPPPLVAVSGPTVGATPTQCECDHHSSLTARSHVISMPAGDDPAVSLNASTAIYACSGRCKLSQLHRCGQRVLTAPGWQRGLECSRAY